MRVAQHHDANPRNEVEIGLAIGIEQPRALSADEDDRRPLVCLQDMLGFECLHLFGVNVRHWLFPAITRVHAPPRDPVPAISRASRGGSRPSAIATSVTPPSRAC